MASSRSGNDQHAGTTGLPAGAAQVDHVRLRPVRPHCCRAGGADRRKRDYPARATMNPLIAPSNRDAPLDHLRRPCHA